MCLLIQVITGSLGSVVQGAVAVGVHKWLVQLRNIDATDYNAHHTATPGA